MCGRLCGARKVLRQWPRRCRQFVRCRFDELSRAWRRAWRRVQQQPAIYGSFLGDPIFFLDFEPAALSASAAFLLTCSITSLLACAIMFHAHSAGLGISPPSPLFIAPSMPAFTRSPPLSIAFWYSSDLIESCSMLRLALSQCSTTSSSEIYFSIPS